MAPIFTGGKFGFGRVDAAGSSETPLVFPSGVVYAFSGNNTTADSTTNATTLTYSDGFSTSQKKWGTYTHSFFVNGAGGTSWTPRIQTPVFTPSSSGWSLEFWVYPTAWAGKYLLTGNDESENGTSNSSISINIQSGEIRTYKNFYSVRSDYITTTSNLLNQWNFFQIFYTGTDTKYALNGTQITTFSGNTNTPSRLVFGNKQSDDPFPITGYFQDIVLYNGVNRGLQSVPTTPFGL